MQEDLTALVMSFKYLHFKELYGSIEAIARQLIIPCNHDKIPSLSMKSVAARLPPDLIKEQRTSMVRDTSLVLSGFSMRLSKDDIKSSGR